MVCLSAVSADADTSEINPVGQPKKFDAGKDHLYAIFYQDGAWHLRTTCKKGEKTVFTGRVRVEGGKITGGDYQGLDRARKGKDADWVFHHADGKGFDFRVATFGKVDGINIKLAKCGSLREAMRMIAVARTHHMQVMLGCMIESSIGITAAAHLAPLVDIVDLDGAALLANDPFAGARIDRGQVTLPTAPGLGVTKR